MATFIKKIKVTTSSSKVSYHDIQKEIIDAVQESKINNGMCLVQTPHTTCSVIFEEFVHDTDFKGDEFLQVDLNRILDRVIPRELSENTNYRYPGPKHVEFLHSIQDNPQYKGDESTILNGDAHIKASLFGASVSTIIENGEILTGDVGKIYFVDWDQNRERVRQCFIMIMGE